MILTHSEIFTIEPSDGIELERLATIDPIDNGDIDDYMDILSDYKPYSLFIKSMCTTWENDKMLPVVDEYYENKRTHKRRCPVNDDVDDVDDVNEFQEGLIKFVNETNFGDYDRPTKRFVFSAIGRVSTNQSLDDYRGEVYSEIYDIEHSEMNCRVGDALGWPKDDPDFYKKWKYYNLPFDRDNIKDLVYHAIKEHKSPEVIRAILDMVPFSYEYSFRERAVKCGYSGSDISKMFTSSSDSDNDGYDEDDDDEDEKDDSSNDD